MSETNFTKLFSSITASTIWCESPETKVVWITMLAMADSAGFVYASVPGLSNIAQVSLEDTQKALDRLSSPDEYSRDKSYEGRRIEDIDGGWAILNHPKYRKLRDAEERRAYHREYMRKKRESVKPGVKNVKDCQPQSTQAEGEAEAEAELLVPNGTGKNAVSTPVPFDKIIALWNDTAETLGLPKTVKRTKTLEGQIRQRWKDDMPGLSQWENFFDYVADSKFLTGRTNGSGGRPPFRASLLWITKETNFAKIAAAEYH